METYRLIERYLEGRDPCAYLWNNADMTMIKVLFLDLASYADPANSAGAVFERDKWPRYDGDLDMFKMYELGIHGRCFNQNAWPDREDTVWPIPARYPNGTKRPRFISPRNRWNMLNESYDLLVIPCSEPSLQSRYHRFPEAKTMWERAGAYSLHISPGDKPECEPNEKIERELPSCVIEVFAEWRRFLHMFMDPS
eukprot:c8282_g1_i1.p1 GENE.c8282_g1_i1~~c8282_g1_i1.p1  ORF type:complete len:196 (+),score=27.05 c8282_g1_i1:161-748(+)